jgi:hypothetical protein
MTISLVWLTEAIHPPLDHLSRRQGKRFEDFFPIFGGGAVSSCRPAIGELNDKCKRAAGAALRKRELFASKDDDHPMVAMMMVMIPPVVTIAIVVIVAIVVTVSVMVMVVMMMMVHRMSRGRLNCGGQRACRDECGHESGSERALEHDDLLDP